MSDTTITFLVLALTVGVFVVDRIHVAIVALGVALSLWATGVLDIEQALAGFGDPTVVFIASLFVVSEGLDAAGVTSWAGQELIAHAGQSRTRLVVLMMLLVALLTALISVNGSVAALVPVVVVLAIRLRRSPSQLLLPLAFGAHAGSLLALTGTPVNVIVSDAADEAGVGRFGFFEFALVGVPLVIGTVAIVVLFGERLLPRRTPQSISRDFSDHARTLVEQYGSGRPDGLLSREAGAAEVVIPPRSPLIGETVFPGMVTESGDLVVRAVQRQGDDLEQTALVAGDTLLLEGSWGALEHHLGDPAVLVVDAPELVRRQAIPLGPGAKRAVAVLAAMVLLLATGAVPPVVAGLLAAGGIVLSRVLTVEQAYRGIAWTTVILVGGMLSLSTAMVETGAAEDLADGLVRGRRIGAVCAAARSLPADRGSRPADQQHGDRADRHPGRGFGRRRDGRVGEARADGGDGLRSGLVPDARRHAGEPHGDGPRRLPLRRLLEARTATGRTLRRGRGAARTRVLEPMTLQRGARRTSASIVSSAPNAASDHIVNWCWWAVSHV